LQKKFPNRLFCFYGAMLWQYSGPLKS
jgi:hypothetical protein